MKTYIKKGAWDERVYQAINKLIETHGKDNPSYDINHKPFAVFDWDNTSIIGDVEEVLLYYMITNLTFKMEVEEFYELIRKNVDTKPYGKNHANLEGNLINIDVLSADIKVAYQFIYDNYEKFKGSMSLEEVKETDYYKEFVAKMFYRYKVSSYADDAEDPYCWMSYLLKNYTKDQVMELGARAYKIMKKEPIRVETFTSPTIESKSGRIEIEYFVGIRELEEMANLYKALEENGIDVYIVSASFIDIVRTFATSEDNSYKMDEKKVLGLRLKRLGDGRILPAIDKSYPISIREGKVATIDKLIKNANNYGPVMVGGDSDGDFAMLTTYPDTEVALLVHRENDGKITSLRNQAWQDSPRYFSQGRNLLQGKFVNSNKSVGYNE